MALRRIEADDMIPSQSGDIANPNAIQCDFTLTCAECGAKIVKQLSIARQDEVPGIQEKIAQEADAEGWRYDDMLQRFVCKRHATSAARHRTTLQQAYCQRRQQLHDNHDAQGNVIDKDVEEEARSALRDLEAEIRRDYPELLSTLGIKRKS